MATFRSLAHSRWYLKYQGVCTSKGRKKSLYGQIREYLKPTLHEFARHKACQIVEGHISVDHVHMCIAILPKNVASEIIGYIKGKVQ